MKITFLGTGTSQGVPLIACPCEVCASANPCDKRLRTSALLTTNSGKNILFDIGPDFRYQMLRNKITHLDAILITHAHRDHVAGIDDIRALNYFQNAPMHIYLNDIAATALRRDYRYIFSEHDYPGLPEALLHEVEDGKIFVAADESIMPIPVKHKDLPILGYRIGNFAYITDANYISETSLQRLEGVETLVLNALRMEHHYSHYSLPEALQIVSLLSPKQTFLTHISHEMGLHASVEHNLPNNVHLAYDQLSVEI